jgi:protein-tyrosine phosphatase
MAAAVLANRVQELAPRQIQVLSSGTSSWHVGEGAHQLSQQTWQAAGYLHHHQARQFSESSFKEVDLILVMDRQNYADVCALAQAEADLAKVALLRSFDPHADSDEVPDPWGNPISAYEQVLAMVERAVTGLLATLK